MLRAEPGHRFVELGVGSREEGIVLKLLSQGAHAEVEHIVRQIGEGVGIWGRCVWHMGCMMQPLGRGVLVESIVSAVEEADHAVNEYRMEMGRKVDQGWRA